MILVLLGELPTFSCHLWYWDQWKGKSYKVWNLLLPSHLVKLSIVWNETLVRYCNASLSSVNFQQTLILIITSIIQ